MDFSKAINILGLTTKFTDKELKQSYHALALKWHPDKNNDSMSKLKFQEISSAYEYLKSCCISEPTSHTTDSTSSSSSKNNLDEHNSSPFDTNLDFFDLLHTFTSKITGKAISSQVILNIIEQVIYNCDAISIKLFEGLDKDSSLKLYNYIKQYSDVLNVSNETLDKISQVIHDKFKDDQIIKLHPTIDNLLNDEVYKLEIENEKYMIPLWHHELTYELSGNELRVLIIPKLKHHISIDGDNNLHINLNAKISGLLTSKKIEFRLGEKVFEIPCNKLKIKEHQSFTFYKMGISTIQVNDIYNVSSRADIIIHLTLLDSE
jgi:hypothetical protein